MPTMYDHVQALPLDYSPRATRGDARQQRAIAVAVSRSPLPGTPLDDVGIASPDRGSRGRRVRQRVEAATHGSIRGQVLTASSSGGSSSAVLSPRSRRDRSRRPTEAPPPPTETPATDPDRVRPTRAPPMPSQATSATAATAVSSSTRTSASGGDPLSQPDQPDSILSAIADVRVSIPRLVAQIIEYAGPDKQAPLEQLLSEFLAGKLDKPQLQIQILQIAGPCPLRRALLSMVPQLEEIHRKQDAEKQRAHAELQCRKRKRALEQEECPCCFEPLPAVEGERVQCDECAHSVCGACNAKWPQACPLCRTPRKRTSQSLAKLVHSYHCTDASCTQPSCAETKELLKRLAGHANECTAEGCKICKLWKMLGRTRPTPPAS